MKKRKKSKKRTKSVCDDCFIGKFLLKKYDCSCRLLIIEKMQKRRKKRSKK